MSVNSPGVARSTFGRMLATVAACALPPTCCLCDSRGQRDLRGFPLDLCAICAEMLPSSPQSCERCAIPVDAGPLCPTCGVSPPAFDAAFAPFLYRYPVQHLVRRLKFGGERVHARLLGQLLATALARRTRPLPAALIPLPLHARRFRQRGFNQARDIARYVGCTIGVPVDAGLLARITATREQSGLTLAERRANVRGAFSVLREPRVSHVALVDDVLTTGSTASEAACVLKAAGVARVELWAVARVEGPAAGFRL